MAYQNQSDAYVAFKVQSGLGAQASGSDSQLLRIAGGQQGRLTKATYGSNEVRADGMRTRGRHGSRRSNGAYDVELSLGVMDPVIEAVFRGTYVDDLVITEATDSLTSITTTTSTIVAAAGSWITAGLRVGDVFRMTGHATAGNNDKNLPILALTASTITVPTGSLTLNATPDTAFTITRVGRKLINPPRGSLVSRYFTIEEHEMLIDGSEVFTDAVWSALNFSMQPNSQLMFNPSWVGTGQFETKTGVAAPFFTSPSEPTGDPMSAVEAAFYYGDERVLDLTSFSLTLDNKAAQTDVVASVFSPDVWTGQMGISGSITALRQDLLKVQDFLDETPLSLQVIAVDQASPANFVSIYVPNFTIGGVEKSALSNAAGPRTQTITIPEELVGKDNRGGAFDATMCKIQISNDAP